MKKVAGTTKLDLAQFRELAAFAQFGSDLDASTKAKLDRGARIVELFKQQQYQPKTLPIMVITLYAMQKGFFDNVAVDRIKECQGKLEDYLQTRKAALIEQLGNDKAIDKVEDEIKAALEDFKGSWK
jgi:F-type H+-transporting ATPase subunit alpha